MKRRELLKTAALGAFVGSGRRATAAQQGDMNRTSANDRVSIGMIGVGNFGTANLRQFMNNADAEIVAVCDVSQSAIDAAIQLAGGSPKAFRDYRRLLERRDIDAVVITTPEHWHAWMCIDACDAGKDVYVEKPVAHHIRDGRLMVDAARRKAASDRRHRGRTLREHRLPSGKHLGNIAYRVGRRLQWDAAKEQVVGDAEANRLVIGTYREPWTIKGL